MTSLGDRIKFDGTNGTRVLAFLVGCKKTSLSSDGKTVTFDGTTVKPGDTVVRDPMGQEGKYGVQHGD